jgi:hypothetical protein
LKFTNVSEDLAASIIRAMNALTTRRYNPEDSHLRTHRCENLKSKMNDYIITDVKKWKRITH